MDKINKISSDVVRKATGKGWDEWINALDKLGAEKLTHKEIARMLFDKKMIASGWWAQMVTVGYEYAKGRRKLGETTDQGYEIGVQKTLPISRDKLWDLVLSKQGLSVWLGNIDDFKLEPKFKFKTKDGITGEIRTFKRGERIRLVFKPKNFNKPSTLQLYFLSKGNKSSLGFHTEKLENKKMREEMKIHWEKVLDKLITLT